MPDSAVREIKNVKTGWVFGGREREDGSKCFMVPVPDRTANTLLPIIEKHIEKGSIIYSDCWRAYSQLSQMGYQHKTVNHSANFKDPESGCHTNFIEQEWQKAKHMSHMPNFGLKEAHLSSYLCVFPWKKKNAEKDMFLEFLSDAKKVYDGSCGVAGCRFCNSRN